MGDTWRATLDPRAVFALFLLVEFRYHQLKLPKPPRDAAHDGKGLARRGDGVGNTTLGAPPKKAAAQFRKISSLTPLCTGVNLRVKVVEPIKPAVRRKRRGEKQKGCTLRIPCAAELWLIRLTTLPPRGYCSPFCLF